MTLKYAIIGGGAAGLMCVATLVEESPGAEIHLFEKNDILGAKVIISGGGRCNVTTGIRDKKLLFSQYTRGSKFLRTAIGQFPPEKIKKWFEIRGVPLKIEEDNRVFPVSNNGRDVVAVFEKLFRKHQVVVHYKTPVLSIKPKGKDLCVIKTKKGEVDYNAVVICTGGSAYRHTGSDGDGYAFAQQFGHHITPLGPSLNSFMCSEQWIKDLSGLSLKSVRFRSQDENKKKIEIDGPMIFTHFGISGPAVFALSSHLAFCSLSVKQPIDIQLIPIADKRVTFWENFFQESCAQQGAKQLATILKQYFPQRFVLSLLKQIGVPPQLKNSEFSKKRRNKLVDMLGNGISLRLQKRRPGDEFVTAGGIVLSEVNPKTMQSRLHPCLFFAGEVLDIDGVTGGFNLQASWATGRLAAHGIMNSRA